MPRILASQASLHKLEIFCLVCETESVTRVAERIRVAQPVVSAHLRFLEEKLGVKLFERNGRRLALTADGRRVYTWANDIITRTRELERELDLSEDGEVGGVVAAASMTLGSYVLPRLFAEFRRVQPRGGISLSIANPRLVTSSIRDGSCDFGVTILDNRQDVEGLYVEKIWTEQLVLVIAPESGLAGASADPAAIGRLPFVTSPRNQVRREIEEDALRVHGIVDRDIVLEFGHPEAMKQAVRAGAGAAFMMEASVRDELNRGLLTRVLTPGMDLSVPVFLVYRRGKGFSAFQSALIDFIRGSIDSHLRVAD